AYKENGKKPDEGHINIDVGYLEKVEHIVEKLLGENVECIIAMDDYLCSQALHSLQKHRIEVPKQMKVVSFYDGSFLEAGIPAIRFDIEELGEMTCKTLLKMIEGEDVKSRILPGYQIVM
ncbi:MAG: substrate-binding domain-containing protein, partial [Lachnospiraceae bacterium]|nr:substrate-binding domain-containing protein [Lachnospiraceae bacterium]